MTSSAAVAETANIATTSAAITAMNSDAAAAQQIMYTTADGTLVSAPEGAILTNSGLFLFHFLMI